MVLQKKIGLNRNEYRKIAQWLATAAWCIEQCARLRRKGSRFATALGFDFMPFSMSISGWDRVVVIEFTKNFLWNKLKYASRNWFCEFHAQLGHLS